MKVTVSIMTFRVKVVGQWSWMDDLDHISWLWM
jgi:hypothetical protein